MGVRLTCHFMVTILSPTSDLWSRHDRPPRPPHLPPPPRRRRRGAARRLLGATIRSAAVAAWRGPDGDADLRRWALGHAILAPNSHNRQPWLVDLREANAIVLRIDRERLLPETDPWFRQIVVSQGTFIEALVLALRQRGLEPAVALFPEGEFAPRAVDDRPVARITWVAAATPRRDPLFDQLLKRHTAKVDYDTTRPVAAETLERLRERAGRPGRCASARPSSRRGSMRCERSAGKRPRSS